MKPHDPLTFLVLNPSGLVVRGRHDPVSPAVHPLLNDDFGQRHAEWRQAVLARPGGFDGTRAVLQDFHYARGVLTLRTAYRSYTEGLALRDSLRHARERSLFPVSTTGTLLPRPELSWGMSLTCYVLLPQDHVLCAERNPNLISLPGLWTCSHTEIIEPTDIDPANMQPLLERLVAEELPSLAGLGAHKFIGLSLRKESYVWQLVAVIDLRRVDPDLLGRALLALQPDAETSAWSVCPLEMSTVSTLYPEVMQRPAGTLPVDFDIAQFLGRAVPPC